MVLSIRSLGHGRHQHVGRKKKVRRGQTRECSACGPSQHTPSHGLHIRFKDGVEQNIADIRVFGIEGEVIHCVVPPLVLPLTSLLASVCCSLLAKGRTKQYVHPLRVRAHSVSHALTRAHTLICIHRPNPNKAISTMVVGQGTNGPAFKRTAIAHLRPGRSNTVQVL